MKPILTLLMLASGVIVHAQATHELHVVDDAFVPNEMNIQFGDTVHIIFDEADHTFTQVTQGDWINDEAEPMPGGYQFGSGTPNPGTDFKIVPGLVGTIFYVCELHVTMGMKGTIDVLGQAGATDVFLDDLFRLAPNPANERIELLTDATIPLVLVFRDESGRSFEHATLQGTRTVDTSDLPMAAYVVEIRDRDMNLLGRQRLLVVH